MNIKDLFEQRQDVWHNLTITYITVGNPTPTKPDQNEFDQERQLVYFMDEDGQEHEMSVYVPSAPQGLEYLDPKLTGTRAVFKIKHKDRKYLTGVLTDKKPDMVKLDGPDWEAIAEGKCRHGYIVAEIRKNGVESLYTINSQLDTRKLRIIKSLAKFSMTGIIKEKQNE